MQLALNSLSHAILILGQPQVIILLLIGVLWGAVCGALPGVGSGLALGVVLPLTFAMDPIPAVAFLVSISIGVQFGNGIPAVLLGVPGTPGSFLTAIDGYAMTRQGKTGEALGTMWFAGVFGQLMSIPFFVLLVVPLSSITYTFLSPELFALYCLGLCALVSLTGENIFKGLAAAAFGVLLAMIGPDPVSAIARFDFGLPELRPGLATVPAVLGLVTISELIRNMRQAYGWDELKRGTKSDARFPGFRYLAKLGRPVVSGSLIGTLIGAIPGMSGAGAVVMAYQQAKLTSKTPERFGHGSEEGIAANESAGNASQAGELVPTLGLGLPASDTMVLLLGALLLQGFVPGPLLLQSSPELLYAAVAGLLGAALVTILAGWSVQKVLLRLVRLDRRVVFPLAFLLTLVGVYSLRRSVFDVLVLLVCGLVGYYMLRYGYSTPAAAVGLLLGAGFESNLRQGLLLVDSNLIAFVSRPWTAAILGICLALLVYGVVSTVRVGRKVRARSAGVSSREPQPQEHS
jgi:putative tricarboxylic transport membrane protein